MIIRNENELKFHPYQFANVNPMSYDTGEGFYNRCHMNLQAMQYEEKCSLSDVFWNDVKALIAEGAELDDISFIAAVNNVLHYRVKIGYSDAALEGFEKECKEYWKNFRAEERRKQKQAEADKEQAELRKLDELGISQKTLRRYVEGRVKMEEPKTQTGLQPGYQVMQKVR